MPFKVKGIQGECDFDPMDMRDGLRISGYATRLQSGSADAAADAMEKIGDIALKYFKVDGQRVHDIAGLIAVQEETSSAMLLTAVTLKFMEMFEDFL